MILFSIFLACSSSKKVDPSATQVVEEKEVVQGELHGSFPPENLPPIEFTALNYDGTERNKDALLGHPTVMWFYPYAQTTGWTIQGCGFRDLYESFQALGVEIVAVGFSSIEDNAEWVEAKEFQFEIWSDTDRSLGLYYGAATSADQSAASRVTKILDSDGKLVLEYNSANFMSNPQDVLEDCQILFSE